ncbi:MAG: hypothetical protein WC337_04005 [Candidatus Muiribacteriota bacterium]
MNILYIDTTEKNLYLSLYKNNEFTEFKGNDEYTSVTLLDSVDEILKKQSLAVNEIDVFCVNIGPGSFTGTRTGVITAAFFSELNQKKLVYINKEDDISEIKKYAVERENQISPVALYERKSYFEK